MAEINSQLVTSLWGNPNVDFLVGSAVGASSGTLLVWDSLIFTKVDQLVGSHFIGVIGKWHGVNETIALVNIYGPQGSRHKEELWSELQNIMNSIEGVWIFLGDFNAFFNIWRDAKAKALVRVGFDHCPIVLFDVSVDFGLKSFKLFNHWMENVSFSKVVENSWKSGDSTGSSCDIVLNNKIKKLKVDIKTWWHGFSAENESKKKEILSRLVDWDVKAESVRKKSRRQNNRCWVEDPTSIFSAAYEHFANRFRESNPFRSKFHSPLFKRLDQEDVASMESSFSMDEVKAAFEFFNFIEFFESRGRLARGCNASFIVLISKVPDPLDLSDYRPISLIGCMYKRRQILDGSLAANEIVNFAKKEGIDLLLFKVDFEKAFDSVNWKFLMDTMAQMNFGPKWPNISLLQYVDDALFFGEWSVANARNLVCILELFHDVSGMKINLSKICIFGIGIPMADVANIAREINYSYVPLPFNYLGLPVGKRINIVDAWNEVISKVHGSDGGFEAVFGSRQKGGVWANIIGCCSELNQMGISLRNLMVKKASSSNQTRFWSDAWIKDQGPLKLRYPRLIVLGTNINCFVAERYICAKLIEYHINKY
ncbi:RNA-directed DNA polymerase, eukaryota [Tanacetum coccineum]